MNSKTVKYCDNTALLLKRGFTQMRFEEVVKSKMNKMDDYIT